MSYLNIKLQLLETVGSKDFGEFMQASAQRAAQILNGEDIEGSPWLGKNAKIDPLIELGSLWFQQIQTLFFVFCRAFNLFEWRKHEKVSKPLPMLSLSRCCLKVVLLFAPKQP